jgi:hypothetical protein
VFPTDTATFTVGGSFGLGANSYVDVMGHSALSVTGNFTLADDSFVYNGEFPTDTATFIVGGSFGLGANSFVYDIGSSTLSVTGNFTLGANSFVYDIGSSTLSVTGNFTLGDTCFFVDLGSISVGGIFDPGTGDPNNQDVVSGSFIAAPGSSVATSTATWEVPAGGLLDVAAGATFRVAPGGSLLVDGSVEVEGTFVSSATSAVVVEGNGELTTVGAGQIDIQGTLLKWANPADISDGTALGDVQLNATANMPGTFTYTLADGVTLASGAVLDVGPDQILNVTFIPDSTAFPSARAQVKINVG